MGSCFVRESEITRMVWVSYNINQKCLIYNSNLESHDQLKKLIYNPIYRPKVSQAHKGT